MKPRQACARAVCLAPTPPSVILWIRFWVSSGSRHVCPLTLRSTSSGQQTMKLLLFGVFACCVCLLLLVPSFPLPSLPHLLPFISRTPPPPVGVLHAVWGSGCINTVECLPTLASTLLNSFNRIAFTQVLLSIQGRSEHFKQQMQPCGFRTHGFSSSGDSKRPNLVSEPPPATRPRRSVARGQSRH